MTAAAGPKVQLFEEFPDSNFSGFVPVFYELTGVLEGKTCALLKLLSPNYLNSSKKSFGDILRDGRIGSVGYENGVVKAIYIFEAWQNRFKENNVTDYIIRNKEDQPCFLGKEVKNKSLTNAGYNNMAKMVAPLFGIELAFQE